MNPFSALAIAVATCQFLGFTSAIFSESWKICNTKPGHDNAPNTRIRAIAEHLVRLNDVVRHLMQYPNGTSLSAGDEAIMMLGKNCDEVALRLFDALNGLQKK